MDSILSSCAALDNVTKMDRIDLVRFVRSFLENPFTHTFLIPE